MSTATNLNELVIDRRTWLRGGKKSSKLRNAEGEMCCLGFRALQCGYSPVIITNVTTPRGLLIRTNIVMSGFESLVANHWDTEFAGRAMDINDDASLTALQREARLIELFAKNGIALTFEN